MQRLKHFNQKFKPYVKRKKKNINLGKGEIFVKGVNNLVYVALNLIYHYIEIHNCKPPSEFIDALTASSASEDFVFFKDMEAMSRYNHDKTKKDNDKNGLSPLRYLFYD